MQNKRILLLGGVGLLPGRVRDAGAIMVEICDELEPLLRSIAYSERAPFRTVSLIVRFGSKKDLNPEYGPLDAKNDELPVSVELEMRVLKGITRDQLKKEFKAVTLSVLLDIAQRYELPQDQLVEALTRHAEPGSTQGH